MKTENKLKNYKMKRILSLLFILAASLICAGQIQANVFADDVTYTSEAISDMVYTSANHKILDVDKDKVYAIDCTMAVQGWPKTEGFEYEKYFWFTVANFHRIDSQEDYVYAPDYLSMPEEDYVTEAINTSYANPPRAAQENSCHTIFEAFDPNYRNTWASYGDGLASTNFIPNTHSTIIKYGYDNPGNQIFGNGDVTFVQEGEQLKVRIPFMFAQNVGNAAYLDEDYDPLVRSKVEPDLSQEQAENLTPTFRIMDFCYMDTSTGHCVPVSGGGTNIEIVDKSIGSGEPYTYVLEIAAAATLKDGSPLKSKQIHLNYRICPPSIPNANTISITCLEDERHGSAGLLMGNTASKAAIDAMFAAAIGRDDCYQSAGSLSFMSCETMESTENFITKGYKTIFEDFLRVNFSEDTRGALEQANGTMRKVANSFLIVILVVIIISQVSGIGISNYGVKSMLPRLIFYAILVNLSFYLCLAGIDFATILAKFIEDAFSQAPAGAPNTIGTETVVWVVAIIGVAAGAIVAVTDTAAVIPALIGLLGIAIGIIFLFVILAVRQALIILLVAISPLAIMCNVLPGTRSLFNKWMDAFKGALLAYPIVTGLVYGGAYASALYGTSHGTGIAGILHAMMGAAIAIAPVFAAPNAMKASLGAVNGMIGKAQGMLTGGLKGAAGRGLSHSAIARRADRQKQERDNNAAFKAQERQHGIDQKTMADIGKKMEKGTATAKDINRLRLATQRENARDAGNSQAFDAAVRNMSTDEMQDWIRNNGSSGDYETIGGMQNAMARKLAASGDTAALKNMEWSKHMTTKDATGLASTKMGAFKQAGDMTSYLAEKNVVQNNGDLLHTVSDPSQMVSTGEMKSALEGEGDDFLSSMAKRNPQAFDQFMDSLNMNGQSIEKVAKPEQLRSLLLNSGGLSGTSQAHIAQTIERMNRNGDPKLAQVFSNIGANDIPKMGSSVFGAAAKYGHMDHAINQLMDGEGKQFQGQTGAETQAIINDRRRGSNTDPTPYNPLA